MSFNGIKLDVVFTGHTNAQNLSQIQKRSKSFGCRGQKEGSVEEADGISF